MRGIFITFEGTDGAGKTLQSNLLMNYFNDNNIDAVMTREPGGTQISEKIRSIILDTENKEMSYMTEALLYAASRAQHVDQLIMPALNQGKIVVCDRFVDSSVVYQGIARGLGIDTVEAINAYATRKMKPDITLFLDLSPEEGLKRKAKDAALDRLEEEKMQFHQMVYQGYHTLSEKHSERIKIIDARLSPEEMHKEIVTIVSGILERQ